MIDCLLSEVEKRGLFAFLQVTDQLLRDDNMPHLSQARTLGQIDQSHQNASMITLCYLC